MSCNGHAKESDIENERIELENRVAFLECLEACGVDNWEWYDEACTLFEEKNLLKGKHEINIKANRGRFLSDFSHGN
jgi:hypothetical protein